MLKERFTQWTMPTCSPFAVAIVVAFIANSQCFATMIVYDSPDGMVDPNKWNVVGTVTETNNRLNVWGTVSNVGTTSIAWTDDKVNGDPILGFLTGTVISNPSGGLTASATGYIEITNDTDYIRFQYERIGNGWRISSAANYGNNSNLGFVPGEQLRSPEVRPEGNDLVILSDGVEYHRFTNTATAPNSFFRFYVRGVNGSGGENYSGEGAGNPSNGLGIAGGTTVSFYVVPELSSFAFWFTAGLAIGADVWRRRRRADRRRNVTNR